MLNRRGCGTPEGYAWKRPDYVWSPAHYLPLSITRFGMVPAGDAAPSDHYGLVVQFPWPPAGGTPVPPPAATSIPAGAGEIVLYARDAVSIAGNWRAVQDPQAAGGVRFWNPDQGVPKLPAASGTPGTSFDLTFTAEAGRAYRLWIRGKAESDLWTNDSVFVQFSGSVTQSGEPAYRIGTTAATIVSIEEGSGMGLSGWGWQDNGYGSLGPLLYFAVSGSQTIRVQQREDGLSIDQIVLSPAAYLTVAPGTSKHDTTIYTASSGSAPPLPSTGGEILLYAGSAHTSAGAWQREADSSAAGGARLRNPDQGVPKLTAASAAPGSYFELTFTAEAGRAYRLWIRGRADTDAWTNDSAFVQFSGSVTQSGVPAYRIGTTAATVVSIEEGSGMGLSGWGWQDNGYGSIGPLVYFAVSGPQTIRVQQREDGLSIDQIVLSPAAYLTVAPGAARNDSTILR
jgi:hypothetical protein